ncbi:hypothetical protein SUGI_0458910 [Cryptomeria japonica]|nr:hypothetical protein SUGI_0458910 [Cryptomeria japonica]
MQIVTYCIIRSDLADQTAQSARTSESKGSKWIFTSDLYQEAAKIRSERSEKGKRSKSSFRLFKGGAKPLTTPNRSVQTFRRTS